MINNYNSFIEDYILENLINESIIYYSPIFRDILKKIENPIAKELINIETTDIKPDLTFIHTSDEGYLSFITMPNAYKLIIDKYPFDINRNLNTVPRTTDFIDNVWYLENRPDDSTHVYSKSRNDIKVGKFVNKIFPGKYKEKEIEEFVNTYKSVCDQKSKFELVSGDDIAHWYDGVNYFSLKGTLGSSCMANKKGFFDIYTENKDVCKLLILKDFDKIVGRALVWKLKSIKDENNKDIGVEYFMDRQYSTDESIIIQFRNYAKEKGWCFKSFNSHSSQEVNVNGKDINVSMEVKLKPGKYSKYPYMDTFKRYNPEDGTLYNDKNYRDNASGSKFVNQIILEETNGGFELVSSAYWSKTHDRYFNEDEVVWSSYLRDWIEKESSIEVTNSLNDRYKGWYPEGYDGIIYDEKLKDYVNIHDCVYSSLILIYLYRGVTIKVVDKIDDDGKVNIFETQYLYNDDERVISISEVSDSNWYKKASDKFWGWEDYTHILKSIMMKDENDEWVPKNIDSIIGNKFVNKFINFIKNVD